MRRLRSWREIPEWAHEASLALGNFDGVHRGHVQVLRAAHTARPDIPLGVVTFEPHPRRFFRPDDPPFRLTLAEERAALLAGFGVALVVELPFDEEFSEMKAEDFIAHVLAQGLKARHLACGPDFAFGHRRGGNVGLLAREAEARGIGLSVASVLSDAEGPISSSRIRRLLRDGYPERATLLLGRAWALAGVVEHGDKQGQKLGFPTANVALGEHLEPARGVYAVRVTLPDGSVAPGVANIGRRPTLGARSESLVEAHLFDWSGNLYGAAISVALVSYLRPERRFPGIEVLRAQISADVAEARALLDRASSSSS